MQKSQTEPPPTIRIRPSTSDDQATIARFQVEMALETESLRLDPTVVERGVLAVFSDAARGRYFVAECDGQVVGSLLITYEWSDWRNGTVWWIHSVYVLSTARKQGVFSALYSHVRKCVEGDPNLRGLRLYVEKANHRAQAVYRKLGMADHHYDLYEWLKS